MLGGHLDLIVDLRKALKMGAYDGEPAISSRRGKKLVYADEFLRYKGILAMGPSCWPKVAVQACPEAGPAFAKDYGTCQ